MKSKEIITQEKSDAQQSLETILQLEIEIAEKITAARDRAEEKIAAAQENTAGLKTRLVDDARSERDRLISEGVEISHQAADERLRQAQQEAKRFVETGKKFEDEAADYVLHLIMETSSRREEK